MPLCLVPQKPECFGTSCQCKTNGNGNGNGNTNINGNANTNANTNSRKKRNTDSNSIFPSVRSDCKNCNCGLVKNGDSVQFNDCTGKKISKKTDFALFFIYTYLICANNGAATPLRNHAKTIFYTINM